MVRLWPNFNGAGRSDDYRDGIRRILAGHGIAWDTGEDGRLYRVMHPVA